MKYYNKILDGNIPLGVIESLKNNNNYNFKHQYNHYQIQKNTKLFDSDVDVLMNSKWAPIINKSLKLKRDKILDGINNILTKSLKIAIENNKNEVSKIGILNDSNQINQIINSVAKIFGKQFLLLIKELKINNNLSDLHIKLVHLSGLTNMSKKEIDNIASNIGLELELLDFKINSSLNIVNILSEKLTPELITECSNNLSFDCLFNKIYINKLSQIILDIWELILENIMTLSNCKQISNIYAFSIEFADTIYLQSQIKDNIIENFGQAFGNKTKLSSTKRITDITELNKNINQSKVIAGASSIISSAITNAINQNTSDLLRSIAISNKLNVNGAIGTSFTFTNIKQSSNTQQDTNVNFIQEVTNKVINDIATKINENIDSASNQLSNNVKKILGDEKSGSSLDNIVSSYTDIFKASVGNSVKSKTLEENYKMLVDKYNLNQSFKLNKDNNVNQNLNSILSTSNLAKCASDTKVENTIDISKIDVSGPIVFSEIDQNNVVNDVIKCAFNQTIINDIANKIMNDYENNVNLMLENIDDKLDDTQISKIQGDILAAGVAGAAISESAGNAVSVAATGIGTGVSDAATGVGTGVSDAATGVGTGVSDAATGIGKGLGSIMGGAAMPLFIGVIIMIIGFVIWKYTQQGVSNTRGDLLKSKLTKPIKI
jgi:hypothetical protein